MTGVLENRQFGSSEPRDIVEALPITRVASGEPCKLSEKLKM
jgi:hypothetical protein